MRRKLIDSYGGYDIYDTIFGYCIFLGDRRVGGLFSFDSLAACYKYIDKL